MARTVSLALLLALTVAVVVATNPQQNINPINLNNAINENHQVRLPVKPAISNNPLPPVISPAKPINQLPVKPVKPVVVVNPIPKVNNNKNVNDRIIVNSTQKNNIKNKPAVARNFFHENQAEGFLNMPDSAQNGYNDQNQNNANRVQNNVNTNNNNVKRNNRNCNNNRNVLPVPVNQYYLTVSGLAVNPLQLACSDYIPYINDPKVLILSTTFGGTASQQLVSVKLSKVIPRVARAKVVVDGKSLNSKKKNNIVRKGNPVSQNANNQKKINTASGRF